MMEYRTMSERLLKLNHGGSIVCICEDYCSSNDCLSCRIWPKNISTGRIKNRNNYPSRRKYYNQEREEDPGEMSSSVGLCRKTYLERKTYYDQQQLHQSASSLVDGSKDPVGLFYSALSEHTTDNWSSEFDTQQHWFPNVSDRDPFSPSSELNKNVHLSGGQASATTFQSTSSQTASSVGPFSALKAQSSSPSYFLPSFASTNVDGDIESRKLATKVHSSSSDIGVRTNTVAVAKQDSVIGEERLYEKGEQASKEALLRGVFSCEDDALRFERTMENKITKRMTRSRHQRSVCKTNNVKTPDHNTNATTSSNQCSTNDLTEVLDHSNQKLGCSYVCTATDTVASSPSYLGTTPCERHPSTSLLATWPVFNNNNTPYTRPHTQTNNNYNNNNQTVNSNTTSQTTTNINTSTTKTTQDNAPSSSRSVVPDYFIYLTSMWSSRLSNFCSCAAILDTCRRRTSLSTRSATWKLRNYILLVVNMLALFTCVAGQCKVSTCQKQWPTYHMNKMDMDNPNDPHHCRALRTTWQCIRKVSHGCVGVIDYHSEKSRVQKQMSIRKCSIQGETYDSLDQTHRPTVQRPHPECMYKGSGTYKHCGLFGDPHLRTFGRVCQTCKIRGAWPLVDNNRLTVMVTNKPVVVDGSATATSMLTVRIRRNELCGANHFVTYETQANHLPSTFVDGRTHYGPGNGIELKILEPNKHIKIHIKYIDTTILVRQIGRYFTFAISMPEEVVKDSNGNYPELCVQGCPKSEQINYQEFLAHKHQKLMEYKTQNKLVMSRLDAETMCRQAKVVDFYFDSCVFDLMTTGDKNFTVAAYAALHDLLKLNPGEVNENRTDLSPYDKQHNGSASTKTTKPIQRLILLCMTLLSLLTCSRLEEIC